jgi:maltose O-acetyltransferase
MQSLFYWDIIWLNGMNKTTVFSKLTAEWGGFYAFWVFKLLDLLGYSAIGSRLRAMLLKLAGFDIGWGTVIRPYSYIYSVHAPVKIGKHVFINIDVCFDEDNPVIVGDYIGIGHGVKFMKRPRNTNAETDVVTSKPTVVEPFVWIACDVTILSGVTIGEGSVIGAGSLVDADIPPHCFAVGNPAKVVRQLTPPSN